MAKTQGKVHSIISNLVLVKVEGPVSQNEICFIEENGERLMAEVIKVVGDLAMDFSLCFCHKPYLFLIFE